MSEYELKGINGKVYKMHADSPEQACLRAADVYQVTIVAWRRPAVLLVPGVLSSQIIG